MSVGWAGVDLFFVISGYLITTILLGLREISHPYKTFYWRRILRIFPVYYGYLILVLLATRGDGWQYLLKAAFFLSSISLDSFWLICQRLLHHVSFASHILPIQPQTFTSSGNGLTMVWSLSIEEIFYLFWAPIVLRGSRKLITKCAVAPIIICPVLRVLGHTATFPEYGQFVFRIDGLMYGAVAALLIAAVREEKLKQPQMDTLIRGAIWLPLLLLLPFAYYGISHDVELRSMYAFTLIGYSCCGVFSAGLVLWCIDNGGSLAWLPSLLRNPVTTYVGRISYGMYLIHIYAFITLVIILRHFLGSGWIRGIGCSLAASVFTIALASVSWHYFEKPMQRIKDRYFPSSGLVGDAKEEVVMEDATV